MIKSLQSKLFWVTVLFISTLFVPWRVIYKGTRVFMVLPLWWEYATPQNSFMVILGHIAISVIIGVAITLFMRFCVKKYKGRHEANT